MVRDDTWFECDDGTRLYLRRWLPGKAAEPRIVLQVAHGMAEHAGRYGRLAERLCEAGVEVWAADQRGHGKTADAGVNDPGKGGLLGHCCDGDAFERVSADLLGISEAIRAARPGAALFLMGHSWGSFIAQSHIGGRGGGLLDGCALSGTRGPGGFKARAGAPLMAALAAIRGPRARSRLARAAADGPYRKAFPPARTPFDWLSRDAAEVDAYCADPLCGALCSAGFYRDLARGLARAHGRRAMARVPKGLPIYIFCGGDDPVGDMGASPAALAAAYRSLGVRDVELVVYPGARHEPLNETGREEATAGLLSWLLSRASAKGKEG